jgi:hypothetical protein
MSIGEIVDKTREYYQRTKSINNPTRLELAILH